MPDPEPQFPDVVVVIPGILGSTLVQDGKEVWGLSKRTLTRAILTLGRHAERLQLPQGIGDDHPGDGVVPGTLMHDLHVIPALWTVTVGYDDLLSHLRTRFQLVQVDPRHPDRPANLLPFAYDWRLSNRYNARRLDECVDRVLGTWRNVPGHADAKVVIVAHSMGGLLARYWLDVEGGAACTRALVTLGTPHRGAANAVDALVNGVVKRIGPVELNLSPLARSLPSLYQLLPEYACVESPSGLLKTIDRDVQTRLPAEVDLDLVRKGMAFHDEIDTSALAYVFVPVIGTDQPTNTTCSLARGRSEMHRTIEGYDQGGDGTVPRFAARPKGMAGDSGSLHHAVCVHGHLPARQGVLDEIDGVLTGSPLEFRPSERPPIGIDCEDVWVGGDTPTVRAETADEDAVLEARLTPSGARAPILAQVFTRAAAQFVDAPPGSYDLAVGYRTASGALTGVVHKPVVMLDPDEAASFDETSSDD